jgi:hypothetical protein
LGNCYFLSALASLAEYPERIKKLFLTKETNKAGVYAMKLYINGLTPTIVVDDFIPFHNESLKPAFSKARGPELWVMLLEKAWAKINGSYENTIAGSTSEAFRVLTGAPVDYYDHDEHNDIWNKIKEAESKGFLVCASSGK